MGSKKYTRLSLSERIIIETLLAEKRSKSYIAQKLNRARSTIGNEINVWVKNPEDRYKAKLANSYAKEWNDSKHSDEKINQSKELKLQVYKGLKERLSPESISGRLKLMYPGDSTLNISYESIYRHIFTHPQSSTGKMLIGCLTRSHTRHYRGRKGFQKHSQSIKDRTSIDLRPKHIDERVEVGHWEGDLLIGINQNSCIGSIVERKTRYAILVKLDNKKSEIVREAFVNKLNKLPLLYRKTMTYDNGTEMAQHKLLTEQTGMEVYFAHPYSSWERGTNENTNGLIRRFYPKKTDFNKVSKAELTNLQNRLNNRPRKVLGYYTPNEMYLFEMGKVKGKYNDAMVLEMGNKSPKDLFSFLIPQLE
jgi:transposase, IS30 family